MTTLVSNICAIVPAAGYGRRMQTKHPKQYLLIGNKTILEHTITVLLANPRITRVVVPISHDDTYFKELSLANHPQITAVNGGTKRVNSVLAGIREISDTDWVLVHDAVRPCLHQIDLERLLTVSEMNSTGAILATPVRDTMKRIKSNKAVITCTISNSNLWHALTPQFFPRKLLYNCLIRAIDEGALITDEASALEHCGFYPKIIEGRADNIKITYLEDLQFAEFYLNRHYTKRVYNENRTWI